MKTMVRSQKPIGEFTLPVETWNPSTADPQHEFDYIDIASIDRESKTIAGTARTRAEDAPSRARQVVQAGDVLVSTVRPNLNAVAVVPDELDGAIASTGFCVLRCKAGRLHNRYLFQWVRASAFVGIMSRLATGASYPAVTDRIIQDSWIPYLEFDEQQRIANILDKADIIRRKRQEARQLTEDLPMALFRETFHAHLVPDRCTTLLEEVAEVVSGVAKGRQFNGQQVREVPYLRVANVQAGHLDLTEMKTIPATASEIQALALHHGDVVMTEGGDFDKLGRGALWEHEIPDCIHQNHVFRVRVERRQLLPSFFVHFLQTEIAKAYFLRCAKKTTNLASINMRQLRALRVPIPPLGLQQRFEKEVATIRDVVERQKQSEAHANDLFASLVQRAFRGDL